MSQSKAPDPDPWDYQIIGKKSGTTKMTVGPKWYITQLKREWKKEGFVCEVRKLPERDEIRKRPGQE